MEKKTECEIVQDLLLSYTDGVLNPESKKLVEKHLSECTICQKKLQEIKNDIKENDDNQKKEIDYLKKIRRKSRIKAILIATGIILVIILGIYIYKFCIINSIFRNSKKSMETNNFYKEVTELYDVGTTFVSKYYYKDGKLKKIDEIYTDEGSKITSIQYITENTNKIININEEQKEVKIETGFFAEMMSKKENIITNTFTEGRSDSLIGIFGTPIVYSVSTDTHDIGREYYILRNQFEDNQRWECWFDKDTGLPLRIINKDSVKSFYPGTEVAKSIRDSIQEYKYEFGIVTDEDVKVPEDFSGYTVENINTDLDDYKN